MNLKTYKKSYLKPGLMMLSVFLFLATFTGKAQASSGGAGGTVSFGSGGGSGAEETKCEGWGFGWARCVFTNLKEDVVPDLDIKRTVLDSAVTMMTELPMTVVYGKGADQVSACFLGSVGGGSNLPPMSEDVAELYSFLKANGECAQFESNPWAAAATGIPDSYASGKIDGSLTGITLWSANMVLAKEVVPVNFAYYMRDVASQVPFVRNTAFAQEIDTSRFFGYELILDLWKLMRNLAFGMIAVFMVITGMMIIMRKQIDPRTAVTVQNAIPRIVISLVLITFSYALGSLMVGLMGPLLSVSLEPVRIGISNSGLPESSLGPVVTFLLAVWQNSGSFDVTVTTLLLYLVATCVLVIMLLSVLLKMLLSYIKLLSLVVIAPLQFAWAAIPGNEDSIMNWFKSAAAAMLAVPAMSLGLSMGLYFAWMAAGNLPPSDPGVVGPIFVWETNAVQGLSNLVVPLFVMGIFFYAGKIPGMLEDSLLGVKKGKR